MTHEPTIGEEEKSGQEKAREGQAAGDEVPSCGYEEYCDCDQQEQDDEDERRPVAAEEAGVGAADEEAGVGKAVVQLVVQAEKGPAGMDSSVEFA